MGKRRQPKTIKKRSRFWWWLLDSDLAMGMAIADRQHEEDLGIRKPRKRRQISPYWSFVLVVIGALLYAFPTDSTYAITVWPAWIWAIIGFILTIKSKKGQLALALMWAFFSLGTIVELKSYPRAILPDPPYELRVVSLNCAGGTVAAAEEVAAQKPDIIFFQESCNKQELAKLAAKFFGKEGAFLSGPDATIVARGPLVPIQTAKGTVDFVAAKWKDGKGHELTLVSLRLTPPVMRIDLYSPEAWSEFAKNRASRRHETELMAAEFDKLGIKPDLLGGDFNSPPDSGSMGAITDNLRDSFLEAGVGYGATCVNPTPCVVRIDQVWHSDAVVATRSRVVKTENSDHRMLVSDFRWK